jgi:exodeoxyribonuclease VIII
MDINDLLAPPPEPQLIEGIPYEEYHEIPALRASVVKDGLFKDVEKQVVISPRHILASFQGESYKESESMTFGKALHCLLLEPDEFEKRFAYYDGRRDERTKAYQEFLEENEGKSVLKTTGPMSWEWCLEAASELCQNDVVQEYIAAGAREVTGLATVHDVPCKVRYDWLSVSKQSILDVKTTRSIGPVEFFYEWNRYGYGIQMAMYSHVYQAITGVALPVVIVAVENHPPFCSVVYEIPSELLRRDLEIVFRVCDTVKRCLDTNEWPSFASEARPLAVPDWAMEDCDLVSWEE